MITPAKLALCVTADDYAVFAGPDWPSYPDFLNGARGTLPEIQSEIGEFIDRYTAQGTRFPIRTATACQSKWTWSTIYLNQLSTASCHRVDPVPFTVDDFDNFHNVPKKIADRRAMLLGQWPSGGCEYCRDIERAGGWSDRQHNLEIRGLTPIEVEADSTAVHVTPKIVEIFAQNTCNLACVYCNSNLSSKIEQENQRHGEFNSGGVRIPVTSVPAASQQYFDKFLAWLENNIQQLGRLHLLGGETFLQHNLINGVLAVLEQRPSPNLEFNIFSNFNVPDRIWDQYTGRIKDLQQRGHIKCFDLTASIDCWGPAAEYVRSGLNLQEFERKFSWAADQDPAWLRLNVNQTITAMTIRTMPELIERINHYARHRHIGQYFEFYIGSEQYQHPKNWAWTTWQQDFKQIFAAINPSQHDTIQRMQGIQQQLQTVTHNNEFEIRKLHTYLDELDRRRNTNWREIFPYLDIK